MCATTSRLAARAAFSDFRAMRKIATLRNRDIAKNLSGRSSMTSARTFALVALASLFAASAAEAQQQPAPAPQWPQAPEMTLLVTDSVPGKAAHLIGIERADHHC